MFTFDNFDKLVEMTNEELEEQKRNEYLWNKAMHTQHLTSQIACVSVDVLLGTKTKDEAYDEIMAAYRVHMDRCTATQKRIDEKFAKILSIQQRV